jgi:hypothetical protein
MNDFKKFFLGLSFGFLTSLPILIQNIHWLPSESIAAYALYTVYFLFFIYYVFFLPVLNFPAFYFSHTWHTSIVIIVSSILWGIIFVGLPKNFLKKIQSDRLWSPIFLIYTGLCIIFSFASIFAPLR